MERVKAILVGRPKAWEFDKQYTKEQKDEYRKQQRNKIFEVVRKYNQTAPVVQNMDFGHTEPQISLPYGNTIRLESASKKIFVKF